MRIETLTIALLATLAIACVPPQNKTPKKQSSSSVTNGAPHMPDDRLSNNAAANNSSANNESNNISSNNMTTGPGPVCGDGVVEGDESCDGELDVTCEDLGFDGGFTACSSTCAVDTTGCTRASCGDGIVQEGEVCDDGPDNGGYDACSLNCSGFPNPEGASMSLDPSRMTATQNDLGSNWCESTTPFGVGDLGTPGAPNDPCF